MSFVFAGSHDTTKTKKGTRKEFYISSRWYTLTIFDKINTNNL